MYDLFEGDVGTIIDITLAYAAGRHDGAALAASLYDEAAEWVPDQFVGETIKNLSDGSSGTITSNTDKTIEATLSGGDADSWNPGDRYAVVIDITGASLTWHWQHGKRAPVTKTGGIEDGPGGVTRYVTEANDVEADDLRIQVESTLASGWNGRADPVYFKIGRKLVKGL